MDHFGVEAGVVGVLPFIFYSGIIVSTIAITHIIKKISIKTIMVLATMLVSLGLILASQSNSFLLFVFLVFFIGFGNGVMITLPGIYATNHYGEQSAKLQSLLFSFLAFGFVIGPVFPGIVSYLQLSWRWSFVFPGLLLLPTLIPIFLVKHEPIETAKKLTLHIIKDVIAFDKKFILWLVIALLICSGASIALLTWLITFLELEQNTALGTAHIILSVMGIAAVLGRLMWAVVSSKTSAIRTLLIIVPFAAVLVFLAPLSQIVTINIVVFFLAMFFISGINPLLISASAIYPKSHSSSVYTMLFMAMSIGGATVPFGIGQIFQHVNSVVGMSSIAVMFIVATVILIFIKKEIPILKYMFNNPM